MKLLIYGSTELGSNNIWIIKALRRLGCDIVEVNDEREYKNAISFARPGSLVYKAINKYGVKFFSSSIQRKMLELMRSFKPDAVLVIKGYYLSPDTIRKIRTINPKTIVTCFNPDSPYVLKSGTSNSWIYDSIPLYDIYFTWGKYIVPKLIASGVGRVVHVNFAHDPKCHFVASPLKNERARFASDVSFVGSWDHDREGWLGHLAERGLRIYGNAWEKSHSPKLIKCIQGAEVLGREYSLVCGLSKININLLREQNYTSCNMKTFEIPACGGFLLSMRSEEQEAIFPEGVGAAYFSTPRELIEKVDYYLSHNEERMMIAKTGNLLVQKYNFDLFAKSIIDAINIHDLHRA